MDCEGIGLGLVTALRGLRDVLRSLNVGGTRWWLASDPADAIERGYISIGYGYPDCNHPLNAATFRFPVMSKARPTTSVDDVVVVIDSSACVPEQPGFYIEDGELVANDVLETFHSFFFPIQRSLLARLQGRY